VDKEAYLAKYFWRSEQSARDDRIERSIRKRQLTAFHEAGHVVAAWHLGAKILDVSIQVDGSGLAQFQHGGFDFTKHRDADHEQVRDAITISLAGIEAQSRRALELFEFLSIWDFAHAREDVGETMARVFLIQPEALEGLEDPENFYKAYHRAANTLVYSEAWKAIEALSAALVEKGRLSGQDAVAVILNAWGDRPLPEKARPVEQHGDKKQTQEEDNNNAS
jgi:hypothetical protein